MAYHTVARTDEISVGQYKPVTVGTRRLLVCHLQDGFYAIDDTCTHDDGPLAEGFLEGQAIECPRHGARFDVKIGKVLCLPAVVPICSYPTRIEGDQVQVELE